MKHEITFAYESLTLQELSEEKQALYDAAIAISKKSYSPYSRFNVGAALLLEDGSIISASNKENASFPAGVCAERNALNYHSDQFPELKVMSLLVVATSGEFDMDEPVAPCGICRQVICESERMQQSPIEILMASTSGKLLRIGRAADLLPFHFYLKELKK